MSETMSLVIFNETDHVLAAFTEAGAGDKAPDPVDVVGAGLLIRNDEGEVVASLPADDLRVENADRSERVLIQPPNYSFADGAAAFLPDVPSALTLTASKLTVTRAVSQDTECFFVIDGGDLTEPLEGSAVITAVANKGEALLSLTPGQTYGVVVLIPGVRPIAKKASV